MTVMKKQQKAFNIIKRKTGTGAAGPLDVYMDTDKDVRKGYRFNCIAIGTIRVLFGWIIALVTQFHCTHYKPKSKAFLVLGNHTMNLDPVFDVILLRRFVRFVASSNIMRGFPGCFVKWLANPIPRKKGAPADDVIEAVKASLAAGIPVAMYPEGNVTWEIGRAHV